MSQNKVFVGGINFNTEETALEQYFASFGKVAHCKIITDRETGRSRGFAFIEFTSPREAEAAISNADGKEFDGRTIRVSLANKSSSGTGGRRSQNNHFGNRQNYGNSSY